MNQENHNIHKSNFLRAAVLGANDGTISSSSLIVGLAASGLDKQSIIVASMSAIIAGALSMAAGEYVSVSSQSDIEKADIEKEKEALKNYPNEELKELEEIYISRGVSKELARKVALELSQKDALEAHIRDELGIDSHNIAKPLRAAAISATTFLLGAIFPLLNLLFFDIAKIMQFQLIFTTMLLAILGSIAAFMSGANVVKGSLRIALVGAFAIILTNNIGKLF